jgi:hypothetical protein
VTWKDTPAPPPPPPTHPFSPLPPAHDQLPRVSVENDSSTHRHANVDDEYQDVFDFVTALLCVTVRLYATAPSREIEYDGVAVSTALSGLVVAGGPPPSGARACGRLSAPRSRAPCSSCAAPFGVRARVSCYVPAIRL